jgi:putative component of membrane protein insertase Oxa1/YidC/SpoIIIJ protein YidD
VAAWSPLVRPRRVFVPTCTVIVSCIFLPTCLSRAIVHLAALPGALHIVLNLAAVTEACGIRGRKGKMGIRERLGL